MESRGLNEQVDLKGIKRDLKVKIKYLGTLKARLKVAEETIFFDKTEVVLAELLEEVVRSHGEDLRSELLSRDGSLAPGIMINVNKELIRGSDVKNAILSKSSEIEILVLPAVAGG